MQERKFRLKLGVLIQEENKAPLGCETLEELTGRTELGGVSPPHPSRGLRGVVSYPVWFGPHSKQFYCTVI